MNQEEEIRSLAKNLLDAGISKSHMDAMSMAKSMLQTSAKPNKVPTFQPLSYMDKEEKVESPRQPNPPTYQELESPRELPKEEVAQAPEDVKEEIQIIESQPNSADELLAEADLDEPEILEKEHEIEQSQESESQIAEALNEIKAEPNSAEELIADAELNEPEELEKENIIEQSEESEPQIEQALETIEEEPNQDNVVVPVEAIIPSEDQKGSEEPEVIENEIVQELNIIKEEPNLAEDILVEAELDEEQTKEHEQEVELEAETPEMVKAEIENIDTPGFNNPEASSAEEYAIKKMQEQEAYSAPPLPEVQEVSEVSSEEMSEPEEEQEETNDSNDGYVTIEDTSKQEDLNVEEPKKESTEENSSEKFIIDSSDDDDITNLF